MAFPTSYNGWITYLKDWLAADEFSDAQIGSFLDLAQTRMNREFSAYGMEAKTSITVTDTNPINIVSLIADFNKIRLVVPQGKLPCDVDAINEIQAKIQTNPTNSVPSQPFGQVAPAGRYCIDAGLLYLYPLPAVNDIIDIYYYKEIPLIAGGAVPVNSNVFTTDHPDALLYAALMESAPYTNDPEDIPVWGDKYTTALSVANQLPDRIKMGSTPLKRQIGGLS